jgi:signal transduction histidine kinase/HAMP domain-containing protein
MKIKTKLTLGLGFLFALILLLAALGAYYANRLAVETREILKDNYETLEYAQNMLRATDALLLPDSLLYPQAIKAFQTNLKRQQANITEAGELAATGRIKENFELLQKELMPNGDLPTQSYLIATIRQQLFQLTDINLQAITRKSNAARQTAGQAVLYLVIIGTISILLTLTFIVNFPGYIANPIRELTESIKQIANRNYEQRLHFAAQDEFGELADSFNQMARKLDEYEHSNLAQLMFEKRRIETIINKMPDAIIGLDQKRLLLFVNREAEVLLGLLGADIIGQYAPDVALHNDLLRHLLPEPTQAPIKIFAHGKESYFLKEVLIIQASGADETPIPIGQVIILKNITQFQELDQAKTNFIATISHELKTPISAIKMSLKLLQDDRVGDLNTEQHTLLTHIQEDAGRLLQITGELLDLAQVETGNIQLHYRATPPREIIAYACKAMAFQAEQKQITLQTQVADDLPLVQADLEKTAWVLVNFLSNAIRYSPPAGDIIIRAKGSTNEGPPGKWVCFSVQDHGKGIEPQYKERIFDKFFQVPTSDNIKSGTGLGLAISKEFISAQGGSIWVESELGEGATFSFRLPVV